MSSVSRRPFGKPQASPPRTPSRLGVGEQRSPLMFVLIRIISAGWTWAGRLTLKPAGSVTGPFFVWIVNGLAVTMPVRKMSKMSPRPERGTSTLTSLEQLSFASPGSGTRTASTAAGRPRDPRRSSGAARPRPRRGRRCRHRGPDSGAGVERVLEGERDHDLVDERHAEARDLVAVAGRRGPDAEHGLRPLLEARDRDLEDERALKDTESGGRLFMPV